MTQVLLHDWVASISGYYAEITGDDVNDNAVWDAIFEMVDAGVVSIIWLAGNKPYAEYDEREVTEYVTGKIVEALNEG